MIFGRALAVVDSPRATEESEKSGLMTIETTKKKKRKKQ